MPKTTADVPPKVAVEYAKAPRGQAIAEVTGDGYTTTKTMKKPGQRSKQFGLPKSGGMKAMKMKG